MPIGKNNECRHSDIKLETIHSHVSVCNSAVENAFLCKWRVFALFTSRIVPSLNKQLRGTYPLPSPPF